MAKTLFKATLECINAQRDGQGSKVNLANKVEQGKDGTLFSREGINLATPSLEVAAGFVPKKKYTIIITEAE